MSVIKKIRVIIMTAILLLPMAIFSGCAGSSDDNHNGKEQITADMVSVGGVYYYDGTEQTVNDSDIEIKYNYRKVDNSYFTFSYASNINAGEATLIVTASSNNPYLYGSVSCTFIINPVDYILTSQNELEMAYHSPNTYRLLIDCDLTFNENEEFSFDRNDVFVILENSHTITNYGTLNFNGTFILSEQSKIINRGTVNNNAGALLRLYNGTVMLNTGEVNNNGNIDLSGTIYTCDTAIDNVTISGGLFNKGSMYVRHPLTADSIKLSYASVNYNQADEKLDVNGNKVATYSPVVTISGSGEKTVTYHNNTHAGEAQVEVSVGEYHTAFYNVSKSVTKTFEILKGTCTATSYDNLVELQATENYNYYNINSTTFSAIPSDAAFEVRDGETLNIHRGSFYVYGTLTNNGTIINQPSYTSNFYVNGTLNNNGELILGERNKYLDYIRLINSGTIINGSEDNHSASIYAYCIVSYDTTDSVINNYGVITNLNNNDDYSIIANLNNYQGATANLKGTIKFTKNLFNAGTLNILSSSKVTVGKVKDYLNRDQIKDVSFNNKGTITNMGKWYFEDNHYLSLSNVGTFNNNGHVWTYNNISNIENITIKTRLSSDNVSLVTSTFDYNHLTSPTLNFILGGSEIESSYFSLSQSYITYNGVEDSEANRKSLKYPGELQVVLSVNTQEYDYGGFVALNYEILKSVYSITSAYTFKTVLNDKNYIGYSLGANIELASSNQNPIYYTIDSGQTLSNNGYKFTLGKNVTLTNNGTINLTQSNDSEITLEIKNAGKLLNNGVLNNDGVIYINTPSETLISTGSITNNGKIYVFESVGDTNNVYIRKYLPSLELNGLISLSDTEYVYDEVAKTPEVILDNSSGHIDVEYLNNLNAGTGVVKVSAKELDESFAGNVTLSFNISRGTKHIGGTWSSGDIFENSNYKEFVLTSNLIITKSYNSNTNSYDYGYGVLQSNTTLNLNGYTITFGSQYNSYDNSDKKVGTEYGIKICNGALVTTTMSFATDFTDNIYFVDSYVLSANISDNVTFSNQKSPVIENFRKYTMREDGFTYFTLDLNGYSLEKGITFSNYKDTTFNAYLIDSSEDKTGSIGHGTTNSDYYSIKGMDSSNGQSMMIINLNGINNIGRSYVYTGNGNLQLVASDCTFNTTGSGDRAIYIGAYTSLNNCLVTGPTAIYVSSKDETIITNCTITSLATYNDVGTNNGVGSGIVQDARSSVDKLTISNCIVTCNGYAIEILKLSSSSVSNATLLSYVHTYDNVYNATQGKIQIVSKSSKY